MLPGASEAPDPSRKIPIAGAIGIKRGVEMTQDNEAAVAYALLIGARDVEITEAGHTVSVISGGKIKLPAPTEAVRQACKGLYMAACNIRDQKQKKWRGISIPSQYWPTEGTKRGGLSNPSPDKPLFKASIGNNVAEFDKSFDSEEALLAELWAWMEPIARKKWQEYHTMEANKPLYEEFSALINEVKPFMALKTDDNVKVASLTPLLISKGYKQAERLATHLLQLATGESKEKDLTLLEKIKQEG